MVQLSHLYMTSLSFSSVQFSSVAQSCLTLCDPMNHSTPGIPIFRKLIFRGQETGIKTIPKKKKCKKAKWLSEALQIAVKRREAKSKGEKERYTHLNAEFKRIARRDKKAFLRNQCKEIEENNRMGKTRDLFKKMRDTNAKDGLNKGQKW